MAISIAVLNRRATVVVPVPQVRIPWETISKVMRVTFEEIIFWGTFLAGIAAVLLYMSGLEQLALVSTCTIVVGIVLARNGFGTRFVQVFGVQDEDSAP